MRKIYRAALAVFFCLFFSVCAFAAESDYIVVTAVGSGTSRMAAVDQAWMEAVRVAVGAIVSGKTELNNDELTEKIILHSRGIVESYNVIDEKTDGKKFTVTIEAKVHRVTLTDLTKTYGSTQTVKISAADAIKEKENVDAKEKTVDNKNKTGAELLEEVISSYEPGMFMTASIVPNVFFSKEKKTYSIEIIEKFNEDLFWKEFLPRLRQALDGVAVSKTKGTYSESVRTANQVLAKDKYLNIPVAIASYYHGIRGEGVVPQQLKKYERSNTAEIAPYMLSREEDDKFRDISRSKKTFFAVVPDNLSSYTAYEIEAPEKNVTYRVNNDGILRIILGIISKNGVAKLLYGNWFSKFSQNVSYSVSFLDDEGNELHVQPIKTRVRYITIYRSVDSYEPTNGLVNIDHLFYFAPGFSSPSRINESNSREVNPNFLYLDTTNLKQRWQVDEFMNDEMDKVSSIKLEQIFE